MINSDNYINLLNHYLAQGQKMHDIAYASSTNRPFDQKHFSMVEDQELLKSIGILEESIDILT